MCTVDKKEMIRKMNVKKIGKKKGEKGRGGGGQVIFLRGEVDERKYANKKMVYLVY